MSDLVTRSNAAPPRAIDQKRSVPPKTDVSIPLHSPPSSFRAQPMQCRA